MTHEERPPHLLHFRISHYNEKVRWALDHKGWAHTREAFTPGFHVAPVRMRSGQSQLPVFVLDGTPICGSAKILREIEARRPAPALFPEDPALRRRADELERFFDEEVAPAVRRLFWSTYFERPADLARMATDGASGLVRATFPLAFPLMLPLFRRNMGVTAPALSEARASLGGYLDRIEREVGPSGYLVGDRFGVADLAVAAVMTAILRPPEFSYPLPEPWPPALVELKESIASRPGAQWVYDVYRRHRGRSAAIREA